MIAWSIAGSDSGGGAGIQADLKTFQGLGVHGCTVVTAVTAQNTRAVEAAFPLDADAVLAQVEALRSDLVPRALKLGMLGGPETVSRLAETLPKLGCFIVCDPVMVATSGDRLMSEETHQIFVTQLLPKVDLLTPNLPEAEALTGCSIDNTQAVEAAAARLHQMGVQRLLIKGGHASSTYCQDYYSDGETAFWLTGRRLPGGPVHGTGCTLSAAITACITLGYPLEDALVIARAYVTQGIRLSKQVGSGARPVFQGAWPEVEHDLPWITNSAQQGASRPVFPDCGPKPLGFYPIVDRLSWLQRLAPLGVRTAQLRIKDLEGDDLEREIGESISFARRYSMRLFINDHWECALRHGAYGVHLGQEDLPQADLKALSDASLRLGVSTHCYREMARALAVQPSYIAIGPVYHTNTKQMPWIPQGPAGLARWRRSLSYPLVAIGGINLERAEALLAAGADSLAVITAITESPDPETSARQWLSLFP